MANRSDRADGLAVFLLVDVVPESWVWWSRGS
jgi:hypothetical protein